MSGLQIDESLCADELFITAMDCSLRVRSNSAALIADLVRCFSHIASEPVAPDIDIVAIERDAPELDMEFINWKRTPRQHGCRETYVDLPAGRLVRNMRSGMMFLQSKSRRLAAGPCRSCRNQLIDFIRCQYRNQLQNRGWLMCRAAGVVYRGKTLGIAGYAGSGKSTLMLHLMQDAGVSFLGDDRLFLHEGSGTMLARGLPELPRVNPGTIVHNTHLHRLLPVRQRRVLLQMPVGELWDLEERYQVPIDRLFGPGRTQQQAPLAAMLILDWQQHSDEAMQVEQVELATRPDLLEVLMESPGPLYQYPDGSFLQDSTPLADTDYRDAFSGVAVYVARGRVDFAALTEHCLQEFLG